MITQEEKQKIWKEVIGLYFPEPEDDEISLKEFCDLFKCKIDVARDRLNKLILEGKVTSRIIKGKKYYKVVK